MFLVSVNYFSEMIGLMPTTGANDATNTHGGDESSGSEGVSRVDCRRNTDAGDAPGVRDDVVGDEAGSGGIDGGQESQNRESNPQLTSTSQAASFTQLGMI